jgi:SAM-dependent methyltransferase
MEAVGGLTKDVSALAKDMEAVGGLTKDVSALAKDMEAVGGLTKDVSALARDMEAVGGLTKDVSALAKQSEKVQGRLSETASSVADQSTRVNTLAAGLAAIQRSLAAATTSTKPTALAAGVVATPEAEPVGEVPLDRLAAETVYAAIEDRLRGSPEVIREQQSGYVDLIRKLPGSKPVADLGCGRGEFLGLLAESGIAGVGVDLSSAFVAECREQDLDVTEQDLLAFLGAQKDKSLRAVVSFQVLEHLPFPVLLRTYAEAFRVLVPGGLFLNETPNGANLAVGGSTFWLDHTHVRPLHPELLRHFAEFYGYTDVRVDLVSKPEVPWKLGPEAGGEAVGDAVLGLQEYVLSGQDALLVAYRPREPRKPRTSKASTTRSRRSS